jgi:hypothetical protein
MNELVQIYHFYVGPYVLVKAARKQMETARPFRHSADRDRPAPAPRSSHSNRPKPHGSTATNSLYAKYTNIFFRTRQGAQARDIATPKTVFSSSPALPLIIVPL